MVGGGDPAEVTHHFDAANQQLEACLLPRDISAATLDGTDDLESFMTVFFFLLLVTVGLLDSFSNSTFGTKLVRQQTLHTHTKH